MFSAKFGQRKTPAAKTYASLQAGLVGYWPMNDASGDALNQINGVNLTAVNSPVSAAGKINNAQALTRASNQRFYASAGENLTLLGPANYTLAFWFRPGGQADASSTYGLLSNDAFPGQRGTAFAIPASGSTTWSVPHIYAAYTDGSVDVTNPFQGLVTSVSTASWHFFCARRNGTTLKFQLNAVTGTDITMTKTLVTNRTWFHAGIRYGSNSAGADHFNGWLDEITLWNRTLSDSEVTSLYNSGSGIDLRL